MVMNAPSKGARGKGEANRNGNRGNRGRGKSERDALATKADLLAQLTRQAEEHTRILERERAALGLPGRAPANDQANRQGPQPNNPRRRNNYHVYNDQGNKKVFDPRQIPGLGGDDAPPGPPAAASAGDAAEEPFNQTFPDSPNFFPGRVFAIPGTIPPPPNQPQQPRTEGPTIVVEPWREESNVPQPPQLGLRPPVTQPSFRTPRGGQPGSPHGAPGGVMAPPMGPGPGPGLRGGLAGPGMMGAGGKMMPPSFSNNNMNNFAGPLLGDDFGPPISGGGVAPYGGRAGAGAAPFGAPPLDPQVAARLEAEAKKEAYRRELEEQIRAKKQAKEVEERRRREEDAMWEARAMASPQPWDPEARAARRGGGGEPLRDDFGRPVANLRQRGVGGVSPQGLGAPLGFMPSLMGPGPYGGPPGPAGRLTIEIPGGGAGVFPAGPPGPDGPIPVSGMAPMSFPGGPQAAMPLHGGPVPYDNPSGGGGPVLSPGSIPPVSPGNRRFMAAMNDLIAGPSEEQRREKEMARQRLQMDLEQQIREKKERQARERAEQERQRAKEEAELQDYHAQLNAQRQNNMQRAAAVSVLSPGASPHSAQQKQQRAASAGGASMAPPPLPARRQRRSRIIDASWLDAPKPSALPPLSPPPPGLSPNGAQYVRRTNSGMPEDIRSEGGMLQPRLPGRNASHDGAPGGGMGGTVSTMLQQLQEEQSRIREDFARQAAAMERLADDASRALADRDEAWRELQRVRDMLAGAAHPPAGCAADQDDTDSPVIIDTHLLPMSANAIPDPLPAPVTSEVLRRGHHTDPGEQAAAQYSAMGGGGRGAVVRLLKGGGGLGRLGLGDRLLSPVAENGDGGSGLNGELEPMQGAAYKGMGLPLMPPRRSGIPLPPGMPSRLSQLARPRIQSVYGLGGERPPPSRYNSFFGLDVGKDTRSPRAKGMAPIGVKADGNLPALRSGRPTALISPPSPPILRGDILSSPPAKQAQATRSRPAALPSLRVRSGRPQGVTERPPRGPRVPSAATQEAPKSPGAAAGVKLPPMPISARGQASQHNLEKVQSILKSGHEDRLLRGLAVSEDGTGDTGDDGHGSAVGYGTDELVAMAAAVGGQSRRVGIRVREPSLPGLSNVLTPRRAADFLAQSNGISAGGGIVMRSGETAAGDNDGSPGGDDVGDRKASSRAFNSDSIAMYRSLVGQKDYGGKSAAAAAGVPAEGVQSRRSTAQSSRVPGPSESFSSGSAGIGAAQVADGPSPSSGAVRGAAGGSSHSLGAEGAGRASEGGFVDEDAVQAASAVASRTASDDDAAVMTRLSS